MAKLTNHPFHYENETGEKMEFTSSVTLDQDGTFNVSIPDDLRDTAHALLRDKRSHEVHITKPATSHSYRASGKRLDDVKAFIRAAMAEHLKCEVITERVIVYGHAHNVCYSVASDGSVHANGYLAEEAGGTPGNYGRHGGELHATNHAPLYSVGLGARVMDKVTYRRASGDKTIYKRHPDFPGSHLSFDSPAKCLNAFAGLSIDPERSTVEEMPYSDEAAMFFYDAMAAMCKLSEQVKNFLGDKQALMVAIEQRASLLLTGPSKSEDHRATGT